MSLKEGFFADPRGKRYADVGRDPRVSLAEVLDFFEDPAHQEKMVDAELAGHPALSGVVADLERLPTVDHFFRSTDLRDTTRFRQAVGVIVRMVMEARGWERTGRRSSLGQRANFEPGVVRTDRENKVNGRPRWFHRAEHYRPGPRLKQDPIIQGSRDAEPPPVPLHPFTPEEQRAYAERVRKGLARLEQIGTEAERRATLEYLMKALAETRRAEGRPF